MLLANRVTDVFIAGIATNLAVESAARHTADLGLRVYVIEDACASFNPEMHDLAIQKTLPLFADIVTTAEAVGALGATDHVLTSR
jgi:nicotinamidase-related amidase